MKTLLLLLTCLAPLFIYPQSLMTGVASFAVHEQFPSELNQDLHQVVVAQLQKVGQVVSVAASATDANIKIALTGDDKNYSLILLVSNNKGKVMWEEEDNFTRNRRKKAFVKQSEQYLQASLQRFLTGYLEANGNAQSKPIFKLTPS